MVPAVSRTAFHYLCSSLSGWFMC